MTAEPLPRVTVVVPCFNRAESVGAAIGSVLSQDYPDFDVVAVDDGSTDGTRAALDAIKDPRLKVIANPGPKGVCGARNAGARQGTSPWIAFQDSDDLWRPGKLVRQMREALATDAVAVYCAMEIVSGHDDGTRRLGRAPKPGDGPLEGDILAGLVKTSLVSTQTLIVRRDIFEKVGGFDTEFQALVDWELMLRVAREGRVAYIDEELVEQRMSDNSITRSTQKRLDAQERILAKHEDVFARFPAAHAHHHFRIAGAHRDFGHFDQALAHLRRAREIAPAELRYMLMALYTRILSLLPRARA